MIFDKDSFIARPPEILNLRQKLCLEALAHHANATMLYLDSTRAIIEAQALKSNPNFSAIERLTLCTNMWGIVDSVHMFRQLLKAFGPMGPNGSAFFERYAVAQQIRDKMDHLDDNLGNLASSKKARTTLLGSLSYVGRAADASNSAASVYRLVTLAFGTFSQPTHQIPAAMFSAHGMVEGAASLQFSAFGLVFPVGYLLSDLPAFGQGLEAHFRAALNTEIERMKAAGEDVTNALGQPMDGLTIAMDVQIHNGRTPKQ